MALICDTGPLLAALDAADPNHTRCAALLRDSPEDLVVPALVLAELDYWCDERLGVKAWLIFSVIGWLSGWKNGKSPPWTTATSARSGPPIPRA